MVNIDQAKKQAIQWLKEPYIKNPHLEAEILLSGILKKPREFILAHPEYKLSKKQISNFRSLISKRRRGWPIAYLTGHKEFYGLNFFVNKNVLIPRPETELMIDEAINILSQIANGKMFNKETKSPIGDLVSYKIIDVGTGSGCIIITLAKLIKKLSLGYPKLSFNLYGTDISDKVLAVAKKNANLHKVSKQIKFIKGNLLEPIIKSKILNHKSKFFILANLPYLTNRQIKNSPTIKYEPKKALAGGRDGLKYYRELFRQIKLLGIKCYILCEIDPKQTIKINRLINKEFPTAACQIKKDLSGLNRLLVIKFF